MTLGLFDDVQVGSRAAANRVVFGPHVTNLGRGRSMSDAHAAYYARRAAGGCAIIVTEIASVHESDWPYERAPLGSRCARGWQSVAEACGAHGALVLAGLGHAGMQGSTSWTQDVLWAPSLVANVHTREQPLVMGEAEIAALVAGFADAAALAMEAGCDGVELNAGQHSLLRQFCSGLTNLRGDAYGADRSALLREVLASVRRAIGDGVLGVRFCVDELAPWAGMTPAGAAELLAGSTSGADYVCAVRGSIYSEAATQPDGREGQAVNEASTGIVADALASAGSRALLCAQGSIVDVEVASRLVAHARCDLVEMTRAQIADPDLCRKARRGESPRVRPCLLCNQHCLVRDPRNPIVSCCVNPVAGHEIDAGLDVEAGPAAEPGSSPDAVVAGGGVAGLEAARLLAHLGHRVTLLERGDSLGGTVRIAARLPGRDRLGALCDWLEREVRFAGVAIELGLGADDARLDGATVSVGAVGSVAAPLELRDGTDGSVGVLDAATVAAGAPLRGSVVVLDPIGGPIGVGVAELAAEAGCDVTIVTPDVVVGSQLAASGDLVAASSRLARAGVHAVTHAQAVAIAGGAVVIEDRFTGATSAVPAETCVDAGHRLPAPSPFGAGTVPIGDMVAPRGILMAMLEARRAALEAVRST